MTILSYSIAQAQWQKLHNSLVLSTIASKGYNMNIITRTGVGAALNTALLFNLPYRLIENTTLNQKFDIEANSDLNGEMPTIGYYCIGNKGHRVATAQNGIPYTAPVNHRARDQACFNHIPFVLREESDDLTMLQRQKYGLRRREVIDGVNYIAYYLKRIDFSNVALELELTEVSNGNETVTPFVPSQDALNPQQPDVSNSSVITSDGTYLSVSAILPVDFDENDVKEIVNVARVLYDDEALAIISEIGMCSGIDRTVTATSPNGQFDYTEAVGVQICSFITGYWPVGSDSEGFDLGIQGGATEAMIAEGVRRG